LWESVVSALARSGPFVWVLEDLHAADLATLDLLTFLAQPLRAMKGLVVATLRGKDPRLGDRMQQRITRIARDGLEVRLEPLVDDDVAHLTEKTIGRAVSATDLRRLVDLTGGNPLFVIECARAFKAAGGVEGSLGSLPPTVRQIVVDRLELLPDATRDALACGAVLGREFSAATVARMTSSLPARVIDTLLAALRAGLVEETRPGDFRYSHALVRDAIEGSLPRETQTELHTRADAALGALGDRADVVVERARHALAALPVGQVDHALALARRAAELLESERALDRAYELHARIDAARAAGLLPVATLSEKLHVARIARAAGQAEASRRICLEVAAAARNDPEHLARAALLLASDVRPGVIIRDEIALLEDARAAIGDDASPLGCHVLARLAVALVPAVDPQPPIAMAKEAIAHARAANDSALLRDVLDLSQWPFTYASLDERVALATELREVAMRDDDAPRALVAWSQLAIARLENGDFSAFDRDVDEMLAFSDRIGHPRHRWRAVLFASARALAFGRFAESDRWVTETSQLAALTDDAALPLSLAVHDVMRWRLRRRADELAAAQARLEVALENAWQKTLFSAVMRAGNAARMEDHAGTRAALDVMGASASMFENPAMFSLFLAEPYALVGSEDERRRGRAILERERRSDNADGITMAYDGTMGRLIGLIDASLGDLASAERYLREAHDLAVARKQLPWISQTARELASVLRRAGRTDEARQLDAESARIASEIGMGLGTAAAPVPRDTSLAMEKTGSMWHVTRGSVSATIKDSRGMQLLARLVERPEEEIHVLALASDDAGQLHESNAGEMLDERARDAYRERIAAVEEDLAIAERNADRGRIAKHRREKEAILAELSRAFGLGGRSRRAASATERARVNVQKRIKEAIARVSEADAELGRFFDRAVRTGTFCCFRP
jgi:hypothetical protein